MRQCGTCRNWYYVQETKHCNLSSESIENAFVRFVNERGHCKFYEPLLNLSCRHAWAAESMCHNSYHLVYCQNCGMEMGRETLLRYLNVAEALGNVVEEARASERAMFERLRKEAEDGSG